MDNLEADEVEKVDESATRKKRGFWLSTFLILMITVNALTVYIYLTNPNIVTGLNSRATISVLYFLVFIACINIMLAAAIWAWKKWAVYGFYASIIIVFFINLYLGIGIVGSMPGLVGGLIIFFTTKKRWSHFS
jgi:hypothetical protein